MEIKHAYAPVDDYPPALLGDQHHGEILKCRPVANVYAVIGAQSGMEESKGGGDHFLKEDNVRFSR